MEFPRGIEVSCAVFVVNDKNQILLLASTKQQGKWTLPGGHVEPGESILEAAVREVKEETGLETQPIGIFKFGELINPADFHRPAHFIYFDCIVEAMSEDVTVEELEATKYIWCTPEEALTMDLAKGYEKDINEYIVYQHSD